MLKTRVIPVVLHRGHAAIKGKQFAGWRSTGSVRNAVRNHASRDVDELILLDVGATPEGRGPDFDLIKSLASECFMPLTVGGGISAVDHFRQALLAGADKVCIRAAALRSPELISRAAERFGRQAVVVALDFDDRPIGEVQTAGAELHFRSLPALVEFAKQCEILGAGELLVTSVSRDGTLSGYDLLLVREVSRAVGIPVVVAGGAGNAGHMCDALHSGAHAVAAGAIFQWTNATPAKLAAELRVMGIEARCDIGAVDFAEDLARRTA